MKILLSAALLLIACVTNAAPVEYTASYRASSAGLPCGKGTLSLVALENGKYQYRAEGKACVLSQSLDHRSQFSLMPLRGDNYTSKFKGWFSKRLLEGENIDGSYNVTLNGEPLTTEVFAAAELEPTIMMYQLGHSSESQQLSYTWGEETRDYWFEYLGTETIDTELGELLTHKYRQKHPNESRVATLWFSPQHDGLMVKAKVSRLGISWLHFKITEYQIH
ncbi:DUF3108 domain-containing protein [Ferrimonas lipolytica]|uniref:DUF3108 domain-containing protein n=1 Tax=Ferrimonas lipolytica TaxID=2724191 RepID=A0A6H1UFV6_9GAMM|nr:DUF3108 domain-containing protein [Ferrimonas lipolytica]QIZ77203.1 DUF3108 domain-containing protein [Ferrimonas lipolytica]